MAFSSCDVMVTKLFQVASVVRRKRTIGKAMLSGWFVAPAGTRLGSARNKWGLFQAGDGSGEVLLL